MKYRIKIITHKNGKTTFFVQVKRWYGWSYVNGRYDNEDFFWWVEPSPVYSRGSALSIIDNHYGKQKIVKSIEFEYITKDI